MTGAAGAGARTGNHGIGSRTTTRALLTGGVVAMPLYVVVSVAQGATRDGFEFSKHAASLLTNGTLGWIQVVNFLVTGSLVVGAAVGVRRALAQGTGRIWAPRLLAAFGVGMIGGGLFRPDAALGFPPGTDADAAEISWHGLLHFVLGGLGFVALVAASFILARRFSQEGHRGWAVYSVIAGVVFLSAFAGLASGSGSEYPVVTLAFWLAVTFIGVWLSALSALLQRSLAPDAPGSGG